VSCIACNKNKVKLVQSHIISNFFRKRLTGEVDPAGKKKYKFSWVNQRDYPRQDLPKPKLMCEKCDSKLGSIIESHVPKLIMPQNINDIKGWRNLPIKFEALYELFKDPFWLGVYKYSEPERTILERFSLSVAWRALHSMAKDEKKLSLSFLKSNRGQKLNKAAKSYIFDNEIKSNVYPASLYYLGKNSAKFLSGKDDEMPFAWAELGEPNEILGIGVILGYWVILWPLFEFSAENYFDKLTKLERICFIHWAAQVKSDLAPSFNRQE
jgi:hypothetical protein